MGTIGRMPRKTRKTEEKEKGCCLAQGYNSFEISSIPDEKRNELCSFHKSVWKNMTHARHYGMSGDEIKKILSSSSCIEGCTQKETNDCWPDCLCFCHYKNENKMKSLDPINHPPHYTFGKHEVIDILEDWFPHDPLLWQVVKYVARAKHKGNVLEDLKKAQFYLNKRIDKIEKVREVFDDSIRELKERAASICTGKIDEKLGKAGGADASPRNPRILNPSERPKKGRVRRHRKPR